MSDTRNPNNTGRKVGVLTAEVRFHLGGCLYSIITVLAVCSSVAMEPDFISDGSAILLSFSADRPGETLLNIYSSV